MASGGKKAVLTAYGPPEVMQVQESPIPDPKADEVRVKIKAAGMAFADIKMRHGIYPDAPKPPFTPGYDYFGIVDAVGRKVTKFKVGEACIGLCMIGAQAEYLTMKTDHMALAPDGLDPVLGAAIPLNYLTAYQMLERIANVSDGDTILIHGGAGGVGTALLDIVKDRDLRVFATASKGKHDLIRSYGATPIDYRTESFVDILKAAGGADAVFDHIGGKHLLKSARAAKRGGRVISFGYLGGVKDGGNPIASLARTIARLKLFSHVKPRFYGILTPMASQMNHIGPDLEYLAREVAAGRLKPSIARVMPLDEIAETHRLLEDAEVTGKIILSISE